MIKSVEGKINCFLMRIIWERAVIDEIIRAEGQPAARNPHVAMMINNERNRKIKKGKLIGFCSNILPF